MGEIAHGGMRHGARCAGIQSVVGEPAAAKEQGLVVRAFMAHPDAARLAELLAASAAGRLVIPIAERLTLAEVPQAQRLAEKGAGGKVVIRV